jgi:hypothetical protein
MSSSLHYCNAFLPEIERKRIAEDEICSKERIYSALTHFPSIIENYQSIKDSKLVERFPVVLFEQVSQLVRQHQTLKYYFDVSNIDFVSLRVYYFIP